jgi:hypothetical protein
MARDIVDEYQATVGSLADRLEQECGDFVCDWIQGCTTQEEGEDSCKDRILGHAGFVPDSMKTDVINEVVRRFGYLVDDTALEETYGQDRTELSKQTRDKMKRITAAKRQFQKGR